MTRVLITNAYSALNRGDGAIILGMVESLRRAPELAGADIVVSSADPDDGRRYDFPVVPSFHSLMNALRGGGRLHCLYFLLVLLPASVLWALVRRRLGQDLPVPRGLRALMREYAASDLVVAAGGGYLYTTSGLHGNVMLLVHLHTFVMGYLLGKPVYLYAQSIGPFAAPFQERLVRAALRPVRMVETREHRSTELLARWRLPSPVYETADAAFLISPSAPDHLPEKTGRSPRIGMTVRRWFRDDRLQEEYEREVARFVVHLTLERGAEVVLLPQVAVVGADDDRRVARRVAALADNPDGVRLVENDFQPCELQWLCGRMDLFVGTRMHSNIFALSMGVPALAIAYQPKTAGIMEQLGLGELVLPMEGLTSGRLAAGFERLCREAPAVRESLQRVLPRVREAAERAGRLIAEDFATVSGGAGRGPVS